MKWHNQLINIILNTAIILSVSIVQAQEKKCNATWAEAINSIAENTVCIEELYIGGHDLEGPPFTNIKVDSSSIHFSYDHTFETLEYDYVWKMRDIGNLQIPLIHLKEAYRKGEHIFLKFKGEYVTHENKQYLWSPSGEGYLYDLNSGTKKTDFIAFSISNPSFFPIGEGF